MAKIIGDTGCPSCIANGRDSTQNHLMLFDNGTQYCNRCGYTGTSTQNNTLKQPERAQETSTMDLATVTALPSADLPERKLRKATLEHFGVKVEYNETDRSIQAIYSPVYSGGNITGYHVRTKGKQFYSVGDGKRGELFGQSACTSFRKLWIFEGVEDAMSGWQVLRDKYPTSGTIPSCVALRGSDKLSSLSDNSDFLAKFEEISLCLDQDEAGKKATDKIRQLHPEYKVWSISEKDASDMLQKGKQAELVNALFSTKTPVPAGFVTVQDVKEKATRMPEWGRLWPWPSLNKATYGRHNGQGIYVGAGVKVGKSEWLNQMVHHIIANEQSTPMLIKFEEDPSMTVRRVAGKIKHKQFHIPDGDFTPEELQEGVQAIEDKIIMFDVHQSEMSPDMKLQDVIMPAIRHAVVEYGVQDVFIDPITDLTNGLSPTETEQELRRFSKAIHAMANDIGFYYYCFCHLKAPETGKPHEEGGKVHSNQFRGSRAMMEKTPYMLGIQRNKDPDLDEVERNTSEFVLLENREFGIYTKFPVYWDRKTGDYLEPKQEFEL